MPLLPNSVSEKDVLTSITAILEAHRRGDLDSIQVTTRSHVDPLRWSHSYTSVDHSLCDPASCRVAAIDARLRDAARNPNPDHEDDEPDVVTR